jgi:meiotic recombination protein DMC1
MQEQVQEESVEDEIVSFINIDELQNHGVNAGDIKKLKLAGIHTVTGVLMQTKKTLIAIKGISEGKVDKIIEACSKISSGLFVTGFERLAQRQSVIRISTGSKNLDTLLGGGIESQSITEAFGEFRTGKSQIAHTLCVTSQLSKAQGGGNGKVAYIDTEGTFRPERIGPIAERYGLDPNDVLENIVYGRAFTHEHQNALITAIASKMVEERFALLIVDSMMSLFRVDYVGRGELADRQQALGQSLSKLIKIAEEFNVAVYITNQVTADPGGGSVFMADPKKPIGGNVMAHASTTRLYLRKGKGEQRICKIFDSPCLAEGEAIFSIDNSGITDPKE